MARSREPPRLVPSGKMTYFRGPLGDTVLAAADVSMRTKARDGGVGGVRSALIVASGDYADPALRPLRAPVHDAQALAAVLGDPAVGGFEVRMLLSEPAHVVSLAVEEFFADRRPDDLLLTYFSCLGIKDIDDELYFAVSNTVLGRLGATAVSAEFVSRCMSRSRSRQVVLLLDCPYAGLFERGATARLPEGMGNELRYGGEGRTVIASSNAVQYRFEGGQLVDTNEVVPLVFTGALVEGLRTGDADRDRDGLVTLDELYDYTYDKVRTANQAPLKRTSSQPSDLIIARRAKPVVTPQSLPSDLEQTQGTEAPGRPKSGEAMIVTPSSPSGPRRIFLSYRHEETEWQASWLTETLNTRFGEGVVFKDVDSIQPGDDFVEAITDAVGACEVLLALIGSQWLTMTGQDERRRLEDPTDFLRLEIEAALKRNVRVIPILVQGARMPRADELPASLAMLARRQAIELGPRRFRSDAEPLLKVLDKVIEAQAVTRPQD
jgi:hypothetical protein